MTTAVNTARSVSSAVASRRASRAAVLPIPACTIAWVILWRYGALADVRRTFGHAAEFFATGAGVCATLFGLIFTVGTFMMSARVTDAGNAAGALRRDIPPVLALLGLGVLIHLTALISYGDNSAWLDSALLAAVLYALLAVTWAFANMLKDLAVELSRS